MAKPQTILEQQGRGPVTVEVDDEWEHEIELEESTEQPDEYFGEYYAEGRDLEADDVRFRFVTPDHEETPVFLERRHARDGEWERLGEVTDVAIESSIG